MKKYGIFYGSTTGVMADVARRIADKIGIESSDVYDVSRTAPSTVAGYENLIFGTSTWGAGEEQEDWFDFLDALDVIDMRGKRIALVGVGDETMADSFCSGVGELYKRLQHTGADFVGSYPANVYSFNHSAAIINNSPVGLLLDEVNHPDLTDGRIDGWLLTLSR